MQTGGSVMKKIILMCLFAGLVQAKFNESDIYGVYVTTEDESEAIVLHFKENGLIEGAEFKSKWKFFNGSWLIKDEKLCYAIGNRDKGCHNFGIVGNKLIIDITFEDRPERNIIFSLTNLSKIESDGPK